MMAASSAAVARANTSKHREKMMGHITRAVTIEAALAMPSLKRSLIAVAAFAAISGFGPAARAQPAPVPPSTNDIAAPTPDNAVMLTVFFKHDQSRPLSELNAQLDRQGFYKAFPPAGVEVVSWYVMMGIGQVVTLRLPASRLREVNRILENTAWGSYHTEFYPTYDYKPTGLASHEKALQSK